MSKDDFGARQFSFGTQFKAFRADHEKEEVCPFRISDYKSGEQAEESLEMKELTKDQTQTSLVNQESPAENVDSSEDELDCRQPQPQQAQPISVSFFGALKDLGDSKGAGFQDEEPWDLTSPDQLLSKRISMSSKKRSISAQLTPEDITPEPTKQSDYSPKLGIQALRMPRRFANTASKGMGLSLSASRLKQVTLGVKTDEKPVKNPRLQQMRNRLMMSQDLTPESDTNSHNTESSRLQKIHLKSIQLQEEFEATQLRNFEAKYDLGRKLGEGMHAQVYLCFKKEDETRKPFAVKLAREDDEEKRMAHRKEFAITNALDHPNIVKSLEIFENELRGEIHQVMEYIDGVEILDSIAQQKNGVYTEHNAKELFRQILQGINYLHEHGVAHRDIKPQNILVTKDQTVFLMDFNVSSKKADSSAAFRMMTKTGTVAFSAPEIFTNSVYDEKVDLWSAGIVLYMMLTGKQPFNEETVAQLVKQITHMELNLLDEALMDVSSAAHDLIEKMLEKDPSKRLSAVECLSHPWLTGNERVSFGLLDSQSNGSFVLNRASYKLGLRRQEKLCGKLSIAETMPVKNLMEDLLKNGLDLSHLSKSSFHGDSQLGTLSLKKNHSLSVVIGGNTLVQPPRGAKESLDIISEEEKTPLSSLFKSKDKSPMLQVSSSTNLEASPLKQSRKIIEEFFGATDLACIEDDLSSQMGIQLSLKAKSVVVKTIVNSKYQKPRDSNPSAVVHETKDDEESSKKDVFSIADSVSN